MRVEERGEALIALASRLARLPGHWSAWDGAWRSRSPAPPELQGVTGVLGEEPTLLVMFRWWQRQTPAQAIAIIEQAESRLPLSLACACLAAARAGRRLRRAPALMATVAEAVYGEAVMLLRFPRGRKWRRWPARWPQPSLPAPLRPTPAARAASPGR
jgi:hypothetical protein